MSHYEALKRAEQELADAEEKLRRGMNNNSGGTDHLRGEVKNTRSEYARVLAEYQEHEKKRREFGNGY